MIPDFKAPISDGWFFTGTSAVLYINGVTVELHAPEDGIVRHVRAGRQWEINSLQKFASEVVPGSLVLDCGAYTGVYSILAAKLGARVVAFEPSTKNRERMEHNLRLNGIAEAVEVRSEAVWGSAGRMLLRDLNGSYLSSGRTLLGDSARGEMVNTVTIDEFLKGNQRPISIVKMDLEGAELKALVGGLGTIKRHRALVQVEVLVPSQRHVLLAYLEDYFVTAGPLDERNWFFRAA